jgi:hypothetical protein
MIKELSPCLGCLTPYDVERFSTSGFLNNILTLGPPISLDTGGPPYFLDSIRPEGA